MSALTDEIVRIATAEIGVTEIDASNSGERVEEYQAATSLKGTGWAWCSAFVCWVVRDAATAAGVEFTKTFRRPTTPGAWALEAWSLAQDSSTQTRRDPGSDILPGDIIVYNFSHCAIAVSKPDRNGRFDTIEGNTSPGDGGSQRDGGGVWKRRRKTSQVRSRIRFKV